MVEPSGEVRELLLESFVGRNIGLGGGGAEVSLMFCFFLRNSNILVLDDPCAWPAVNRRWSREKGEPHNENGSVTGSQNLKCTMRRNVSANRFESPLSLTRWVLRPPHKHGPKIMIITEISLQQKQAIEQFKHTRRRKTCQPRSRSKT